MIVTALAPSYEYFIFYQTLVITPMLFLSGAVFPVNQLPGAFQHVTRILPLAHSIDVIRPIMLGARWSTWVCISGLFALCSSPVFLVDCIAPPTPDALIGNAAPRYGVINRKHRSIGHGRGKPALLEYLMLGNSDEKALAPRRS